VVIVVPEVVIVVPVPESSSAPARFSKPGSTHETVASGPYYVSGPETGHAL
jgi:hypothetical protein